MAPRTITIGAAQLRTPAIFASYRIGDYPRAGLRCYPWSMTGTQGLLLNAFDLLANRRTWMFAEEVYRCKGKLHEYLEFSGPIMLDSGGFNFLRHQEITITPTAVLNVGLELGADLVVVLDHPIPPHATPEEICTRLTRTQENLRMMVNTLSQRTGPDGFQVMPVLHGHDVDTLKRSLDDIVTIMGQEPETVGIGSLAPLAQNGNKRTAVDVIIEARRMLPHAYIHCFSMGSALLMLFAFYCGADTVDSQTWIMSAAFKSIQLPGSHLTRLSSREAERNPQEYEKTRRALAAQLLYLIREEGFAVKNWDTGTDWSITDEKEALAYLDYLEDRDGVNHIHRRACHNLFAFNFEARRVQQAMDAGNLEMFIQTRIQSTIYKRVFEYAMNRKVQMS